MRGRFFWPSLPLAVALVVVGLAGLACAPAPAAPQPTAKPAAEAPKPAAEAAKAPAADKNVLVYAIPNAPPRPTPTPPPPGSTPPPQPVPPQPEKVDLFMYVDTVTAGNGESKFNLDPSKNCLITGVIKRGMHLVFRMKGVDVTTGLTLTPENLDSAVVKIPGIEDKKMRYGKHGDDWHWGGAAWDVPTDYPLGLVDFSVEATTKAGKKGVFKQIALGGADRGPLSRLEIIE
ncbi:MAG: hypothetical protein HY690_17795 [Chloroflexi bacterium]|nr:hypothetical protein [Chloroflexota bacterium]